MKATLRIQNFKSLKDITIELKPLTFLFGPNGSGKSNLMQAIRFFKHQLSLVKYSSNSNNDAELNGFILSDNENLVDFNTVVHNNDNSLPIIFIYKVSDEKISPLEYVKKINEDMFDFRSDEEKEEWYSNYMQSIAKNPRDLIGSFDLGNSDIYEKKGEGYFTFESLNEQREINFEFKFFIDFDGKNVSRRFELIDLSFGTNFIFDENDSFIQHPLIYDHSIHNISISTFSNYLNSFVNGLNFDSTFEVYFLKSFFKNYNVSGINDSFKSRLFEINRNKNRLIKLIIENNYKLSSNSIYSAYIATIILQIQINHFTDIFDIKSFNHLSGIRKLPIYEYPIEKLKSSYYGIPLFLSEMNYDKWFEKRSIFDISKFDLLSEVDSKKVESQSRIKSVPYKLNDMTTINSKPIIDIRTVISKLLAHLRIAKNIYVNKINNRYFAIYLKTLDDLEINITQFNSGTLQLLPILFYLAKFENISIEQPELHLHPKLQSKFIEIIVKRINWTIYDTITLVETHSEHMIRKVQVMIAKKELKLDDVAVYYFIKDEKTGSIAKNLIIDENGNFKTKWPHGFFDESTDLVFQLIEAQSNRKN